jgi:hypothetical protein
MGISTLRGIVTGDRRKYGPEPEAKLLDTLKISPEEWNTL